MDTPPQGYPSLSCGPGAAGNAGATVYCCTSTAVVDGGGICAPDPTVSNCTSGATGYSCTGSNTPSQANAALTCGAGTAGNAGSTLYCCSTSSVVDAAADAGTCALASPTACPENMIAYACSGSAQPQQSVASLSCGPGTPGVGTTSYCCAVADAGSDAAADAATCAVGADTGNATCDQCLDTQCCSALVACDTPDDAGVDSMGASACEQLLSCILSCLAGNPDARVDAGTLMGCQSRCGASYTATEQQNATAVLTCQSASCSTPCQ